MSAIAEPLSYNYTIKEVVDEVRSITKEEDEQISSDDNIKAHLQWAIHNMIKIVPMIKDEYLYDIPFVEDYDAYVADPAAGVSTITRPATSLNARVIKILQCPEGGTITETNGLYNFHYEHPENFIILGWKEVWNELTGTARKSSDYSQLQGHARNNNTQLARTVAWTMAGRNLWVSVREGMIGPSGDDVIIHGIGWRTPLKLVELAASLVPTGAPTDHASSDEDETKRLVPEINDWDKIDCPDDYVPLAINLASIKVWSQVGKMSKEQETAALERAYGQHFESSEMQLAGRQQYEKAHQYRDRAHQ
jgi:hypothetical protein